MEAISGEAGRSLLSCLPGEEVSCAGGQNHQALHSLRSGAGAVRLFLPGQCVDQDIIT